MNIENERKLFEEWAYKNKWNIFRYRDMGIDKYVDDFVDGAWHGWQASANREGFVLVPVEPTQNMINASVRRQWDELSYPMECMETLKYKAMIEASQENKDE